MRSIKLVIAFFFLFIFGGFLYAGIDLYYFDSIKESNHYKIYSNISNNFNLFIGEASESMFKRLKDTFLVGNDNELNNNAYKKDSIFVFNNKKSIDDFMEDIDRDSLDSLIRDSLTKSFNPAPNGVYGFNTQIRKFSDLENIVFFIPNIELDPYEEIYNYAPLFQALTEQFLRKYYTIDLPNWLLKGILLSVEDYKKEFVFNMKYRLENYKCASYERTFWTKVVSFNRYWNNDKFTLNQVLDDRTATDESDPDYPVYEAYISLLVHYLFFNPDKRLSASRRLLEKMHTYISENKSIDTETLKGFIMEEFGNNLNILENEISTYYSPRSQNLKIRYFWGAYNNRHKSNIDLRTIIHTTTEASYPEDAMVNSLRNVNDGDMENFYQSEKFFRKGESIIIDMNANLMTRKILVNFGDFGVGNSLSEVDNNLAEKARIISSVDGKSWMNWGYINSDMPVVYITEIKYSPLRYWGIVIDENMETPITINEMWVK